LVGGVVAAAVGGGAAPSDAESVTARGGEIVAREAPGTGQAGIAVLRGSDRVQLTGERDGWSEILLPDGRRAWVPSAEITRIGDTASARSTHSTESPVTAVTPFFPDAATVGSSAPDRSAPELTAEVARLRGVVNELTAWRAKLPEPAETPPLAEGIPWMIGGVALLVGLLTGSAWERHRSRRDRSLRF